MLWLETDPVLDQQPQQRAAHLRDIPAAALGAHTVVDGLGRDLVLLGGGDGEVEVGEEGAAGGEPFLLLVVVLRVIW